MSGSPVQIAEGMLKILNPEKQSAADIVLQAAIDSFVSLPQDMWTLAKDMFDTENSGLNERERIRLGELTKRGVTSKDFWQLIFIVINRYVHGLNHEQLEKIMLKVAGSQLGKLAFKTVFASELASWFGTYIIPRFLLSAKITGVLGVGAMISRSIYSSRDLKELNESIYYALREAGDLDLLYFMVEDVLEPWIEAINYLSTNRMFTEQIIDHFVARAPKA